MEKAIMLVVALVVFLPVAAAGDQTLDGCQRTCGDVQITYPFGVGISSTTNESCFLEESFELTCKLNKSTSTLLWGNIPVIAINISQSQVDMMILVAKVCHNSSWGTDTTRSGFYTLTGVPSFTISSNDNKFLSVGCDTYGYLYSFFKGNNYSTGCTTTCYGNSSVENVGGHCSGIGCCQVDIPPGLRNISTQAFSFENFNETLSFNNCSYSFVIKNGNYTFSKEHLENLPYERVPVVFDWSVGKNETCEASKKRGTNACKGNSSCTDTGYGYQCRCKEGYEGNPYHPEGCRDLSDYKLSISCIEEDQLFEALQVGILNEENEQEIMEVAILAAKCLRLKGQERPSMKEVAMELEGIRLMQKHRWTNSHKNLEETQYLIPKSSSRIYEHGDTSSHLNIGYESIRDQVLVALDNGR